MAGVYVTVDQSGLDHLLHSEDGVVGRNIYQRAKRVEGKAKRLCPVNTGRLRASIGTTMTKKNGEVTARVGTNVKYARYVHDGTGLFGPRHARIYPKTGKVMVFTPKGGGTVFARSTRGQRGVAFLATALKEAV